MVVVPSTTNGSGPRRSTTRPAIGESRIVVSPNVANVTPTSSTPPPWPVMKRAQIVSYSPPPK